jgi:hypothetical protein
MRLAAFAVLLVSLALAACNPTPTPGGPTATPTATPQPAPTTIAGATATPQATPTPAAPVRLVGVSLSPASYGAADFTAFLEHSRDLGLLRWAGVWAELSKPDFPAALVATLGGQYGFVPVVETGVYSAGAHRLTEPLDDANIERLAAAEAQAAADNHLPYLCVGVEVTAHYDDDPARFERFVTLLERTYAAVKAASPGTQVYVNFQLEHLRGLRGGLFGGVNDEATAHWELLERFPQADLIAFTTYPSLIYRSPADIPDDYYAEIARHTDKPIAFTETRWPAATVAAGWESDEAAQAAFIQRLDVLTAGLDVRMLVWLFAHAQALGPQESAFKDMTLFRADGTPRPAWDAWLALKADAGS